MDKKVAITCEGFKARRQDGNGFKPVSYTHLRAHET